MYKLKNNFINETLAKTYENNEVKDGLAIYSLDEIPSEWKNHLVKIK